MVHCSKLSLALIISMLGLLQASLAQNSQQDYLNAHNSARTAVRVGPLVWDNNVAAFAQNYANQRKGDCSLVHSGGGPNRYGENLAMSTGDMSATQAVNLWVGEKPYYDYNSNGCTTKECRHYTQVVWRNSAKVGCAKVQCTRGGTFITCNYSPAGNVIGQRPY